MINSPDAIEASRKTIIYPVDRRILKDSSSSKS